MRFCPRRRQLIGSDYGLRKVKGTGWSSALWEMMTLCTRRLECFSTMAVSRPVCLSRKQVPDNTTQNCKLILCRGMMVHSFWPFFYTKSTKNSFKCIIIYNVYTGFICIPGIVFKLCLSEIRNTHSYKFCSITSSREGSVSEFRHDLHSVCLVSGH